MTREQLTTRIANGRTDLIGEVLALPDWQDIVTGGDINILRWLVFYDDVTALKWVEHAGLDLAAALELDRDLADAAFFGHWRTCDFLISRGADVNYRVPDTGETPLHNALCKAGRPYFRHVIRLLLDCGADPNVQTIPGQETGAFMRDVRTCGETPLHRAGAFADLATIELLLERGADIQARDANGDSALSWASMHLRPSEILSALCFGDHQIHPRARKFIQSDHGAGWGNGMEWKFVGAYLPESVPRTKPKK